MNRFDLTSRLVAKLKNEEAVVGGIGNTNFDLWAAGHRPQNFYMLGSMGLAFPIALGVALAQPKRRVFALEGDGSLLMQMGCLSTIATLAPKNLTMVVMDNGVYQITGAQPTPGRRGRRHRRDRASAAASPTAPGRPTKRISSAWSISRCRRGADADRRCGSTTSPASAPPAAIPCRSGSASCSAWACGRHYKKAVIPGRVSREPE